MKKIIALLLLIGLLAFGFSILNNKKNEEPQKQIEIDNDTKTLSYFEDKKEEIEEEIKSGELKEKTKEKIVDLTDFVFYDKEINGVKYSELKEETKEKLRKMVGKIDEKVEEKVPNYKEQIKETFDETYPIVVDKIKEGITYVDETLEEVIGKEDYDNAKEKISEAKDKIKEKSKEIIEKGKENISTAKDKAKAWYEGWR